MRKNELLRLDNSIIRVLDAKDGNILFIPCLAKSMPKWDNEAKFADYLSCSEAHLRQMSGIFPPSLDDISLDDRRIMHERYTLIAGILPFIGDEKLRCEVMDRISADKDVSKQTIRKYLRLFLIYQDIAALAPNQKSEDRPLTQDEKNMRWALNKYFYTRRKNSLTTAYTHMLKERYCDADGKLLSAHPTIHQFRYYYRKHMNLQTFYISRDGLKDYQRNNRPLLGDGVQEFAPNVGTAMLDSTICDIYLVNESGNTIGRPILTACIDAYSGLCCGYALTWEGGMVGTPESAQFFEQAVQLARRALGLQYERQEFDEYFHDFCCTVFGYQYTSLFYDSLFFSCLLERVLSTILKPRHPLCIAGFVNTLTERVSNALAYFNAALLALRMPRSR